VTRESMIGGTFLSTKRTRVTGAVVVSVGWLDRPLVASLKEKKAGNRPLLLPASLPVQPRTSRFSPDTDSPTNSV
jgi:hypothetical protein